MTPITPALLRAEALPCHDGAGDKEARGRVLVVGGSLEVPGAALLAGVGFLTALVWGGWGERAGEEARD